MANGKVCPVCGKDIGVWAIVSAGLPSRIRCPHCRARLRYDGTVAVTALPFAIVVLCALVVHEVAVDVGVGWPGLLVAVMLFVTWVPVELLLAVYLRENRTLRMAAPQTGPPRGV